MESCKATKQFLQYEKDQAKEHTEREKIKKKKAWTIYDSDSSFLRYERDFARLMEKHFDFHIWALKRKEAGQNVNVLDLMGPGSFIFHKMVDNVLGVTLVDLRDLWEKTYKNREILAEQKGEEINIYSTKTWRKINDYLDKKQIKSGFDLIVCRPAGPFMENKENLNAYLTVYGTLLQRAYKILSPDNGLLLTQVPLLQQDKRLTLGEYFRNEVIQNITKTYITEWKNKNIEAKIASDKITLLDALKIIKNTNSPAELPLLSLQEIKEKIKEQDPTTHLS